jgi:hypothetical protein
MSEKTESESEAQPKDAEEAGSKQSELTDSQLENVSGGFLGGLIKKAGGSVGTPVKPVTK